MNRWLRNLFRLGLKRPIEQNDIYETIPTHDSKFLTDQLANEWQNECAKEKPSLLRAIWRIHAKKVLLLGLFYTVVDSCIR